MQDKTSVSQSESDNSLAKKTEIIVKIIFSKIVPFHSTTETNILAYQCYKS